MGYINTTSPSWDNIAGEDCEYILQRTATDITTGTYSETVGYDEATGWGRINIGRALAKIKKGFYTIKHIDLTHFATGVKTSTPIAVNVVRNWPQLQGVPQGTHNTIVYEQTTTLNFSLSPTQSLIAVWPHTKECVGNRDSSTIRVDRPYYCEVVSFSQSQVVLRTYFHYSTLHNKFYPADNTGVNAAASLYIFDPTGVMSVKELDNTIFELQSFPNPTGDVLYVDFFCNKSTKVQLILRDLIGKTLMVENRNIVPGNYQHKMDIQNLPSGVYFLSIVDDEVSRKTIKVIKK